MKKILLGLVFCVGGLAQQSSTIYQVLLTNSIATGPTTTIRNIGQSAHYLTVTFGNRAPSTCTGPNFEGQLEYSYDDVNWTGFGGPQSSAIIFSPAVTNYYGIGAFPFVRFDVFLLNSQCTVSAAYSGTLYPSALGSVSTGTSLLNGAGTNFSENPVLTGGVGNANIAVPDTNCNNVSTITQAASQVQAIGSFFPSGNVNIYVCSIAISGTATSTLQFFYTSAVAGCTVTIVGSPISPLFQLTGTNNVTLGSGKGIVLGAHALPSGDVICGVVTGSGSVSYTITYAVLTSVLGQ